jgi:hypothetical protein
MKISLIVSERIYALALLNQFKGNLETLVDVLEDIKEFRMTEEDWERADKQVNTVIGDDGKPITSWTWNDEKGGEKEIEITNATKDYLIGRIKEANDKEEFSLQDKAAITLSEKLEEKKKSKRV